MWSAGVRFLLRRIALVHHYHSELRGELGAVRLFSHPPLLPYVSFPSAERTPPSAERTPPSGERTPPSGGRVALVTVVTRVQQLRTRNRGDQGKTYDLL